MPTPALGSRLARSTLQVQQGKKSWRKQIKEHSVPNFKKSRHYLCLDEMWFAGAEEAVKTLVSDNCGGKKKKKTENT